MSSLDLFETRRPEDLRDFGSLEAPEVGSWRSWGNQVSHVLW
jgi:hypothetical protein